MARKSAIKRELLFELIGQGYTQKEIREITGVPERTQRRLKTNPKHRLIDRNIKRLQRVLNIEKYYNIDISRLKKTEIISIKEKGTRSPFFDKYRIKEFTRTSKTGIKFGETVLTLKEFRNLTYDRFKKIVGDKVVWVSATGSQKRKGDRERSDFAYSAKSAIRATRRDFSRFKNYVNNVALNKSIGTGSDASGRVTTAVIITTRKLK